MEAVNNAFALALRPRPAEPRSAEARGRSGQIWFSARRVTSAFGPPG